MTSKRKRANHAPTGAARSEDAAAKPTSPASPYNGWFDQLAQRIQSSIESMRTEYNFDKGNEFEVAICEVLRDVLPERAAVARGFVVALDGKLAGDDIIVYDAARFPTFRHLRRDLRKKEHVPAEAVLAYIEAKHSLYLHKEPTRKQHGQSLVKALDQIAHLKELKRTPVTLDKFLPRFGHPALNYRRPGFPNIRNPWYGAVWALNVVPANTSDKSSPALQLTQRVCDSSPPRSPRLLPDVIAAGNLFASPTIFEEQIPGVKHTGHNYKLVRPFLTRDTRLTVTAGTQALGLAVLHLFYAIEDLLLGEIAWPKLMMADLSQAEQKAPQASAGIFFSAEEQAQFDYPLPAGIEPPLGGGLPDPALSQVKTPAGDSLAIDGPASSNGNRAPDGER